MEAMLLPRVGLGDACCWLWRFGAILPSLQVKTRKRKYNGVRRPSVGMGLQRFAKKTIALQSYVTSTEYSTYIGVKNVAGLPPAYYYPESLRQGAGLSGNPYPYGRNYSHTPEYSTLVTQ